MVSPISRLMRHGQSLQWTWAHSAAVDKVARHLAAKAKLKLPDSTKPFTLEVEAGNHGYGGVLLQHDEGGALMPVGCVSKLFKEG